jgi:hypothetical protein
MHTHNDGAFGVGKLEARFQPAGLRRRSDRPNPAKPEPRTSPGNPNLETQNPKQQKTERAKRSSSDVGDSNYFRVPIFTLFRNG